MARRSSAPLPFTLRFATTNAWISQLFDAELSKRGIEPFQSGTLVVIARYEPLTPSQLQGLMGVPFTTIRNRLHDLVKAGLIVREPNPEDRRSYLVRTTPAAAEVIEHSTAAAAAVRRRLRSAGIDVAALSDEIDRVREVARTTVNGDASASRGSLTTGPW
jgi:DNA-binding MarR family transcriptional regulator